MIESISSTLLSSIKSSYERIESSSAKIAGAFTTSSDSDIIGSFQELSSAKHQIFANVKTLKVINELEQQLLDIVA